MAVNLTVANPISGTLEPVQAGSTNTPMSLSTAQVLIQGQDNPGTSLPLQVIQSATSAGAWGRVLRLQGAGSGHFFDFGIDTNGNLFLNGPGSTQTKHLLMISPTGVITVG